jgi:cell division septum initiation protein DivIVA
MSEEEREQLERLKKLSKELDAARTSVDETVKHIESAHRQADQLVTEDKGRVTAFRNRTRKHTKKATAKKRKASKRG